MKCKHCSTDNPDNAHFCSSCGTNIGSAFDSPAGPVTDLGSEHEPETVFAEPGEVQEPVNSVEDMEPPAPPAPPSFTDPVPIPTRMPEPELPPTPPTRQQPPVNPNAPGAGLAPPPGNYQQQQQQPYGQAGQQPGYGAPQSYGYGMPSDGNTSGMGEGFPLPYEAEGWSFAGFIPWGLFSFINGNTLWGILYWVFSVFGLGLIYVIFVGINGKKQAWQGRRFDSVQQFVETMKAWNTWGLIMIVIVVIAQILGFAFMTIFWAAFSEEMSTI